MIRALMQRHGRIIGILTVIIIVGSFVRFWHLDLWLHFSADEVRDLEVMRNAWETGHLPLLGPEMRGTGFHYGPLFYYLLLLPNVLSGFAPVAGAVVIASLAVLTIPLVFWAGKLYFGIRAGVVAAALWSVAPVVVYHSRWAWNPNPLPFFVLLILMALAMLRSTRDPFAVRLWMLLIGLSLGASIQFHFSSLTLFLLVLLAWPILHLPRPRLSDTLLSVGSILVLAVVPLIAFEIFYGGHLKHLFVLPQVYGSASLLSRIVDGVPSAWLNMFRDLVLPGAPIEAVGIGLVGLLIAFVFLLPRKGAAHRVKWFFLCWFGIFFVSLFFSEVIVRYYFLSVFPLVFLMIGAVTQSLTERLRFRYMAYIPVTVVMGFLVVRLVGFFINLDRGTPDEYTVTQGTMREVITSITQQSGGKPFSLEVVPEYEYGETYRYLFSETLHPPSGDASQVFVLIQPADRAVTFFPEAVAYKQMSDVTIGSVRVLHLQR